MQYLRQLFSAGPGVPPAPWKSADLGPETIEAISRGMMMDLARRIGHAFYAYPLLIIVLWTTSTIPADHPQIWMAFTLWFGSATIFRAYLLVRREVLYDRNPKRWRTAIVVSTLTTASGFGLLLMLTALWYRLENWNLIATLVFAIGMAAGSVITLTPWYGLMWMQVVLFIVPGSLASAWLWDIKAASFSMTGFIFVTFLLVQGATLNRSYVSMRWEQAVSRKRELELEQARRAAEAASEAKSQFLANLSHEIRTPMNGILGMAHLALEAQPEPAVRECIETLEQCANGLLQILNDMLDFSKIEAGKLVLERIPFSLHELLADSVRMLAAEARIKGLRLEVEQPREPVWIQGDPVRLRQVLLNLIGNAIKFTSEGYVKASFSAAACPGFPDEVELEFAVADSGIGIEPAVQRDIFEAFRQADGSVTRRFGGTGLGLAICSRMVKAMGGKIQVESRPGEGSRFWFSCRFPVAEPVPESILNLNGAIAGTKPQAALSILVAEDNPVNQRLIERLLVRRGHAVKVAANGKDAVEAARHSHFDLILMDISMPELDGMEASRQLRQWEASKAIPPTPIVALTANAMKGDRERFTAAGIDGYLAKPFSAEQLYAIVGQFAAAPAAIHDPSYSE